MVVRVLRELVYLFYRKIKCREKMCWRFYVDLVTELGRKFRFLDLLIVFFRDCSMVLEKVVKEF